MGAVAYVEKSWKTGLALVLFLHLLLGMASAESILGTVTADGSGVPVAGASVEACTLDDLSCYWAATDPTGGYSVTGLAPGDYRLHVYDAAGYIEEYYQDADYATATVVSVTTGVDTTGINLGLAQLPAIAGRVFADGSGTPIAFAQVQACQYYGGSCYWSSADADGNYLITGLVSDDYRVRVFNVGSYVSEYYQDADYSAAMPVSVGPSGHTTGIDFGLAQGGSISGSIVDSQTLAPLQNSYVYACPYPNGGSCRGAYTDVDGQYTIDGIAPGSYYVRADNSGEYYGEYYLGTQDFQSLTPIMVTVGSDTPDIDFRLAVGGQVSGRIVADDTGLPLIGANVSASGPFGWGNAMTDANGDYLITGLAPGDYRIRAYNAGDYADEYYNDTLYWSDATVLNVALGSLTTGVDFGLPVGAKISGYVTLESDGSPVAGINVQANGPNGGGSATTDTQGYYEIGGLSAGNHTVSASGSGTEYLFLATPDGNVSTVLSQTSTVNFTGQQVLPSGAEDECTGAKAIASLPYTDLSDTSAATTNIDDPGIPWGSIGSNTVWYSYTPIVNEVVSIDTVGSEYNPTYAVYSGDCGNLVLSTFGNHWNGQLTFSAAAGTSYYIVVGDNGGMMGGKLRLSVDGHPDTDGDFMPDDWEDLYGLDKNDPADVEGDLDLDGVSNLEEYELGTLPNDTDTDKDGLSDGWEIENWFVPTDPSDAAADLDGDGLSTLEEVLAGTDYWQFDSDGDGHDDSIDNCPTLLNVDQLDSDGDGTGDICQSSLGDVVSSNLYAGLTSLEDGLTPGGDPTATMQNPPLVDANTYFELAAAEVGSQDQGASLFFHALARIATVAIDTESDMVAGNGLNDMGDILDAFGIDSSTQTRSGWDTIAHSVPQTCTPVLDMGGNPMFDWDGTPLQDCVLSPLPTDSPTSGEMFNFLDTEMGGELTGALGELEGISESFNFRWANPMDGSAVELDYGDVLFLRAVARGALAALAVNQAYDLNADIDTQQTAMDAGLVTAESFLSDNPTFGTLINAAKMLEAKGLIAATLDDMEAAVDHIAQETDLQFDDLVQFYAELPFWDMPSPEDQEWGDVWSSWEDMDSFREGIRLARQALAGPMTVEDKGTPLDTSDDVIYDLSPFFAGIDLRALLPTFSGDEANQWWPDETFGGVLVQDAEASAEIARDANQDVIPDMLQVPKWYDALLVDKTFNTSDPSGVQYAFTYSGDGTFSYVYEQDMDTGSGTGTWSIDAQGRLLMSFDSPVAPVPVSAEVTLERHEESTWPWNDMGINVTTINEWAEVNLSVVYTDSPDPVFYPYGWFSRNLQYPDQDWDTIADTDDNCPGSANRDQADFDGNGVGDVCDVDSDGDGLADAVEVAQGLDPLLADSDGDGLPDNLDPAPTSILANISWAGVTHRIDRTGAASDQLEAGVRGNGATLGDLSITVSGPAGFSYAFTDADIYAGVDGKLEVFKQFTSLTEGHYTFTVTDVLGNTLHQTDLLAGKTTLPQVDAATIQAQRQADGSYRVSWAPVAGNTPHYYRLKVTPSLNAKVHTFKSGRDMDTFETIPAGVLADGQPYSARVEVYDGPEYEVVFNRSDSDWFAFTPQASDPVGETVNFAKVINNRLADGSWQTALYFSATGSASLTSAEVSGPGGFSHTFDIVDDQVGMGEYLATVDPAATLPGLYHFRLVIGGQIYDAYDTLAAQGSHPVPDGATCQAKVIDDSPNPMPVVRFSWADIDHTGPVYYQLQVLNAGGEPIYESAPQRRAFEDVTTDLLTGAAEWQVVVIDSSDISTARNRVEGDLIPYAADSYDAGRPYLLGAFVEHRTYVDGSKAALWMKVQDFDGDLASLAVDGPGGFHRDLLLEGVPDRSAGSYYMIEDIDPQVGLYTFTATAVGGKMDVLYDYHPASAELPPVDYTTFHVDPLPNGNLRISWAPIYGGMPLNYQLRTYSALDTDGDGVADAGFTTNRDHRTSMVASTDPWSGNPYVLPQQGGSLFFWIQARDASDVSVFNNRSTSLALGYEGGGYDYAVLADSDGDRYADNIDPAPTDPSVTSWYADPAAPGAPSVDGLPLSNSRQPTLTWSSGGDGNGIFRYRFDADDFTAGYLASTATSASPASDLADGSHTLYVQERDDDGQWSASGSFAFSVDATAPTAPTVSGYTPTPSARPDWDWTSGGGGNGTFRVKLDDADMESGANELVGTSFEPMVDLTQGSHTLYVQERDDAGNWSAVASHVIVIDLTAPGIPVVTATSPTASVRPTWSWTAVGDGSGTFRYKLDDANLSSGAVQTTTTSFSPAADLSDGDHTLYVQERDDVGNWSPAGAFTVTVDTVGPGAPTVTAAAKTNNVRPPWSWTSAGEGSGNFQLKLDDADFSTGATATTATSFTPAFDLSASSHTLYVREQDGLGNWSDPGSFLVVIDTEAPGVPVVTTTGTTPTASVRPIWTWTAGTGGTGSYRYKLDDADLSTGAVFTTAASFTPPADLADGDHVLYVQETDDVGNWSASGIFTVTVDTTGPAAPVVEGTTPSSTVRPTWSWIGAGDGAGSFEFKLDDPDLSTGATLTTETSFTPAFDLSATAHTLYVREQDALGNWSEPGSLTIVIDTEAPGAPVVTGVTPTNKVRPKWSWTSGGGGIGTFRVKLGDANLDIGATTVVGASYIPEADLGTATHTLYVQEQDEAGNWSATGSFAIDVDPTLVIRHWDPPVGNPYISDFYGYLTVDGFDAQPGDEVAIFDPDGVLCGHVVVEYVGAYTMVPVYGDDPGTPEDEGALPGDILTFRIWDSVNGAELRGKTTNVTSPGSPATWAAEAITQVDLAGVSTVEATVPVDSGWNLVSIPVATAWYSGSSPTADMFGDMEQIPVASIGDVFSSIAGKYSLVRSFDAGGSHTYDPNIPPFFNNLKYVSGGYGYWIKMTEPADLVLEGQPLSASDGLQLRAGWNLVGYWADDIKYVGETAPTDKFAVDSTFTQEASIGDILGSLGSSLVLVRSFDAEGAHTFDPSLPSFFNNLDYMGPGYSYWIKLSSDAVLRY